MKTLLLTILVVLFLTSCENNKDDFEVSAAENELVDFRQDGTSYFSTEALQVCFTTTVDELTQADIDGLLLMREEEKMAREVYLNFYELYGSRVFGNIASSELSHTNAVLSLLTHFGLDDPASTEVGVFSNSSIHDLYQELVDAGSESLLKAFETGAFIEEYDIVDLEKLLSETSNSDILLVYGNLLKGSRNHLRAFVRQITNAGASYSPFLLTEEYFQEIVDSEMDNGNTNTRWGRAGNSASYGDCIQNGNGGIPNGDGTGSCDALGSGNSGNNNSYGKGK